MTCLDQEADSSVRISVEVTETLRELPWHHCDPFDRMLVAQAVVEHGDVVTADTRLRASQVEAVWPHSTPPETTSDGDAPVAKLAPAAASEELTCST